MSLRRRCALGLALVAVGACTQAPEEDALEPGNAPSLVTGAGLDFAFYRDNVEPVFVRSRGSFLPPDPGEPACVLCHTWQTNTPFKLASLQEDAQGGVYWTEAQSRQNFEMVSRLVTPGDPAASRLLRAPLGREAGGSDLHTGGKVWTSQDDPEWRLLAQWVENAAGAEAPSSPAAEVDFGYFEACVHPIFFEAPPGALQCANCHSEEFAQTDTQASWNAVQRLIEPGQPAQSRLLMHPLHPDGGGDYAHNGVRRWMSQSDAEWRALAAWVRGEQSGASCAR